MLLLTRQFESKLDHSDLLLGGQVLNLFDDFGGSHTQTLAVLMARRKLGTESGLQMRSLKMRRFSPNHRLFAFAAPAVVSDDAEAADDAVAGNQVGDGIAAHG